MGSASKRRQMTQEYHAQESFATQQAAVDLHLSDLSSSALEPERVPDMCGSEQREHVQGRLLGPDASRTPANLRLEGAGRGAWGGNGDALDGGSNRRERGSDGGDGSINGTGEHVEEGKKPAILHVDAVKRLNMMLSQLEATDRHALKLRASRLGNPSNPA